MNSVERALEKLRAAANAQSGPAVDRVAQVAQTIDAMETTASPRALFGGRAVRRAIQFDFDLLAEAGFYSPGNRSLADQYRVIKRPLLKNASSVGGEALERKSLIAITSSLAGEGKTFTALNLALSLTTEKDWNVLLVDADAQNPRLSTLLAADRETGLIELLKEKSLTLDTVIMPTNIEGLSVLPLGSRDAHASELLSSERMAKICESLIRLDSRLIVLFDTSPLLLTTESTAVCSQVGQVVLVVRADRTPQQVLNNAIEKLDDTKAIGLVLNCASTSDDPLQQGYGAYGAYGAYGYGAPLPEHQSRKPAER